MPNVRIRNQTIDVDIREELEEFTWHRAKWSADKLIAASPFRHDNTPSFYVHLDGENAGYWGDSGYYDVEWAKGGLVKLLAFLRNETYEETEEYLLDAYGINEGYGEGINLKIPRLSAVGGPRLITLPGDVLANYSREYSYLQGRGISEQVQRQAGILYDAKSRAVVIPWYDESKRLRNVKYRTSYGKTFWYHRGATPVRNLVYGIESIWTYSPEVAVLEEAEIDALSWREVGVNGIASGGANFTEVQADIIKRSPIDVLYISGDNDKAGHKFVTQVVAKLAGYVELRKVLKPKGVKDTNEALLAGNTLQNFLVSSINVDTIRAKNVKFPL
jgi:hypothetical protein